MARKGSPTYKLMLCKVYGHAFKSKKRNSKAMAKMSHSYIVTIFKHLGGPTVSMLPENGGHTY